MVRDTPIPAPYRSPPEQRYTSEEVGEIIKNGLRAKPSDTISHEDLVEIGGEFDLTERDIKDAVAAIRRGHNTAKAQANRKLAFNIHACCYIIVIAILMIVDIVSSGGPLWFQWPTLGWGIGLAAHYLAIFTPARDQELESKGENREHRRDRYQAS